MGRENRGDCREKKKPPGGEAGCDLAVLAAHTDDAEIALGGCLHLLAAQGRRVWVVDLTRGELATNATVQERWAEALRATAVLGLTGRLQLSLPDGFLSAAAPEHLRAVVAVLRRLRPRWICTAPAAVRHPDHLALPDLVRKACFLARLASLPTEEVPLRLAPASVQLPAAEATWEPEALFFTCPDDAAPSLIFDISAHWEAKQAALACYASQFQRTDGNRPTAINDPAFLAEIERRARYWGQRAGVDYGEALRTEAVPVLGDLPAGRWVP